MIKLKPAFAAFMFVLFSLIFLLFGNTANAINISPMTFCTNTCKAPHCQTPTIKQDCKKKCDESIWKQIASLELSKSSKEFRTEKDKTIKDAMLYSTSIAQCLDLKSKEIKDSNPLAPSATSGKNEGGNNAAKIQEEQEALKKKHDEALVAKAAQLEAEKKNQAEALAAKKREEQEALKKKHDEALVAKAAQLEEQKKKQEDVLAAKNVQKGETRQELLKRQQEQSRASFLAMQEKKIKQAQKREALKKQYQEALQSAPPQDAKAAQELKRKQQEEQKALLYKHQEKIRNLAKERNSMGKEHQEERIAAGYN